MVIQKQDIGLIKTSSLLEPWMFRAELVDGSRNGALTGIHCGLSIENVYGVQCLVSFG